MLKKTLFFSLIFCFYFLKAEVVLEEKNVQQTTISAEKDFFDTLDQWMQYSTPTFNGYRIQLIFYSEYDTAKKSYQFFKDKFPNEYVELDYKEPYHRLRVGSYRDKIDAVKNLTNYKKIGYNGAFIVPVKIKLNEFYNM